MTLTQSFDNADRPSLLTSSLNDSQHPGTHAAVDSSVGYWPDDSVRKVLLGNGLTETSAANVRFQPCRVNVNSSSSYLTHCTDAAPSGTVDDLTYGYNAGSTDNGNVASFVSSGQQVFNRTFTYDQVNRLLTMADSASNQNCKGLSWTYDSWANRSAQTVTSGSCFASQVTVNSNNQISGSPYQYDSAGNLTHDANHSYTYDAEDELISVDGGNTATYIYDADGRRTTKKAGSISTQYIYDMADRVVAEYDGGCGATCWHTGYVYFAGENTRTPPPTFYTQTISAPRA